MGTLVHLMSILASISRSRAWHIGRVNIEKSLSGVISVYDFAPVPVLDLNMAETLVNQGQLLNPILPTGNDRGHASL
jgi:hypothetical protein